MKVNLEYYKSSEENQITLSEKNIINKFFNNNENDNLESLLDENSTFEEIKAISDIRNNIISFYPIKKEETVLEINAGFGEITGEFCKKAKKVVSIETKKEKAECIEKRYKNYENLEVYAGRYEDVEITEKFDYVTYINEGIEASSSIKELLKKMKSNLKSNGKLIIIANNKFGIKYWAGQKENELDLSYNTITGKKYITDINEIQSYLEKLGLKTKFYYPMPDYVFTNAIYTDEFLPNEEQVNSRDWEIFNSNINDVKFSEKAVLKELVKKKKDLFKLFTNSILIVASEKESKDDIRAVTYGFFRKPEYRIKTTIKNSEVIKKSKSDFSNNHINQIQKNIKILEKNGIKTVDRCEKDYIVSKYVDNGKTLDSIILELFLNKEKKEAYKLINDFKNQVLLKLEKSENINNTVFTKYDVKCKSINKLTFVKDGLYDLIFQNCFVIGKDYYVYDQEWIEENIPIEFILYRGIINLPEINGVITHKEILERFELIEYMQDFDNLEIAIQSKIKDNIIWNLHINSNDSILNKVQHEKVIEQKNQEILSKDQEILSRDKKISEKEQEIANKEEKVYQLKKVVKNKDEHIQNLEKQLNIISKSISWKLTKPLRFLSWLLNPFNGASFIDRIMPPGGKRRIKYDEKLAKKLWEEKINGYRASTDEDGVEYWKGIEHRERLKKERDEERLERGQFFSNYEYWMRANDPTSEELEIQKKHKFKKRPKISIVIPLYNTPEDLFRELLFNMYRQTYKNWELCLADGSNKKLDYIEKMCKDSRIHYKFLGQNKGISGNSNEGLKMVTGDYVALLDHDDLLMQNALYEIVKVINERPNVRFIYTDEDKMKTIDEPRFDPHFKPDFAPDYLNGNNYICHFSVFKKELMDKLGGFRDEYNGAQDMDIILRVTELVEPKDIYHIPKILYHWRICETSTAGNPETKLYAYESGKKAVQDHINRLGRKGIAERDEKMYGIYKIKYDIISNPKVNILIPNKNNVENIKECIDSIIEKTTYKNYEIDIIDDCSDDLETINYYKEIEKNEKIKIVKYNKENSNYSKLINYGVSQTDGEYILQLTNTSTIITEDWIEKTLGYAQREDVGAVASKIFDKDDNILYAGIIVGGSKGKLYVNQGLNKEKYGYFAKECHIQNFSCVTLNTLICKRSDFEKIGGLDEELIGYEDVDFCLKLRQKGLLNVYMPYSQIYDSNKENYKIKNEENVPKLKEKWNDIYENGDIYYNPNLSLETNKYDIRKEKV